MKSVHTAFDGETAEKRVGLVQSLLGAVRGRRSEASTEPRSAEQALVIVETDAEAEEFMEARFPTNVGLGAPGRGHTWFDLRQECLVSYENLMKHLGVNTWPGAPSTGRPDETYCPSAREPRSYYMSTSDPVSVLYHHLCDPDVQARVQEAAKTIPVPVMLRFTGIHDRKLVRLSELAEKVGIDLFVQTTQRQYEAVLWLDAGAPIFEAFLIREPAKDRMRIGDMA